jgi:PAS domain S-box-containing protein
MSKMNKEQGMNNSLRLLVIDDNPDDRVLTIRELKKEFEIQVEQIIDAEGFDHALGKGTIDIVITDYQLGWSNGLEILRKIKLRCPDCIVIMFTATGNEEIAVDAMKNDLDDYILKSPKHFIRLPAAVKAAIKKAHQYQAMRDAEEALQESEERYRQLVELSPDTVVVHSEGKFVFLNPAGARLFGAANSEQLIGKQIMDFVHPDYQEIVKERIRELREEGGKAPFIEEKFTRLDGKDVDVEVAAIPFTYQDKQAVQVIARDITKRKLAEEQIRTSLKEKEVLLREIHHRVKNNLQVISSLLDMRIMRTDNQQEIDLFEDIRSKIHTMALIHTQVYRSERFDHININTLARELVNYLSQVYAKRDVSITLLVKISDVYLSITQAIPCALVLSELVSNAFKHAFKGRKKGKIEISLKREDHYKIFLKVKDNGMGIPEEIDILKTNSLGLKLMRNTVQHQLMWNIYIEQGVGTTIMVEFKIPEQGKSCLKY